MAYGGFAQAGEFAGRGAESGRQTKETEKANELKLRLDKIESVAKYGYLSPFSDEFFPEVKGMSYEDRLKVINDTMMNAPNKNIMDIVREGGYWLLERIGTGAMGGGGGMGDLKLPSYTDRYNMTKSDLNFKSDTSLKPNEVETAKAHDAYTKAVTLPGIEPEIKYYGDSFINIYGDKKAREQINAQDIARFNQNFQKMKQAVLTKWATRPWDEDYYKDNMTAIARTQELFNKVAGLNQNIFETGGVLKGKEYDVNTYQFAPGPEGDADRTDTIRMFRSDFAGFGQMKPPSFLAKVSKGLEDIAGGQGLPTYTPDPDKVEIRVPGSVFPYRASKKELEEKGAIVQNDKWLIPDGQGGYREMIGADFKTTEKKEDKKIRKINTFIPGIGNQEIPEDVYQGFFKANKGYRMSTSPNRYGEIDYFNDMTKQWEPAKGTHEPIKTYFEEYFKSQGKKKIEEIKKQQTQSRVQPYNKRTLTPTVLPVTETAEPTYTTADYNALALKGLIGEG